MYKNVKTTYNKIHSNLSITSNNVKKFVRKKKLKKKTMQRFEFASFINFTPTMIHYIGDCLIKIERSKFQTL